MVRLPYVLVALSIACVARAEDAPVPAQLPDLVLKRLGKDVVEKLKGADSVEVFRVGKVDFAAGTTADYVGLRKISGRGKAMPKEFLNRVVAAMMLESTYREDSKGTQVGVGFRIKLKDGGRVELSCCLKKGNVQLAVFGAGGKLLKKGDLKGFRDDKTNPLRFLAAEAFPDDEDIKKVTPAEPKAPGTTNAASTNPAPCRVEAKPIQKPEPAPIKLPPGWLPVRRLEPKVSWSDARTIADTVQLYLPPNAERVRGVFVCYVFHSADPRELADLWNFALVCVPTPFEYDLGYHDKRNKRPDRTGLPVGNMGVLLEYLTRAAKETKHPELAVAPLVGWLGQNGGHLVNDLLERAPERVIAWADSFPNALDKKPGVAKTIPFALAWESNKTDDQKRLAALKAVRVGEPTPPANYSCRASTYGFPHGIYSKFNFFAAHLDRCIQLRLPRNEPPPGTPIKLKPVSIEDGWAGDFAPVSEWNPISPYRTARGMAQPVWLPDEYAAWMWRSYHSANPDLKLTAPVVEYRKKDGKWGGPECGLGYGNVTASGTPLRFAAETKGKYKALEFHDGNTTVGKVSSAPYEINGIKLQPGLHALFVVGVRDDGTRAASRPAFLIVK